MENQNELSENKKSDGVQVIARAANILRALKDHPEGLSLSQIAQLVGLARSTVHRIILALQAEMFVVQVSETGGRFRLGLGLASLAAAVKDDLRQEFRPYIEQLSKTIDETVDLSILDYNQVLFLDQIPSSQRLQAVATVGSTFPLHCSANGKALLAELSPGYIERLLPDNLPAFTPNTITSRSKLIEHLADISKEGIAYDLEEHSLGICAVGATVRDARGNIAAITIPVPTARFYGNESYLITALQETCNKINQRFQ
jgi:DNA-binding IclR family transcriptional regulator